MGKPELLYTPQPLEPGMLNKAPQNGKARGDEPENRIAESFLFQKKLAGTIFPVP